VAFYTLDSFCRTNYDRYQSGQLQNDDIHEKPISDTMKKTSMILFTLIMTTFLYGQELKVSVAPTINAGLHYQFVSGGPGQKLKAGLTTSFDYLFLNDKKVNFGIGLNYHLSQVEFIPNLNTGDMILHTENVNIVSLRFASMFKLKNQFYLSLDPSLDIQINYDTQRTLDKQSGLGISFGLGKNFKISESILLNIEPKLCIHNIIPKERHLTTLGLNLGLIFGPKPKDIQIENYNCN
jgi:hypothetical protein